MNLIVVETKAEVESSDKGPWPTVHVWAVFSATHVDTEWSQS
jgi:hypothetical protein